ncbi:MAG: O-methyltransferase [Bacteroidota bacterium]
MDFLPDRLNQYVESHTADESPLLKELNRETYAKVLMPRMLSGHLQGRVLAMLSRMIRPKRILEIGTFTGYSALCLAEGLQEHGSLHTIDINDELSGMVDRYMKSSGLSDRIHCYWGNALDIIPVFDFEFDLVFIDADKINYQKYYELALPKLSAGGWIIADNVLWSGKILDPTTQMDADTAALYRFNEHVRADNRVETVLLPVRDGLMIIRKKEH